MATHSVPVPTQFDFNMFSDFKLEKCLTGPRTGPDIFICLLCHTYKAPFVNYENRMLKVARNDFNIGEVWNPVCCHGNKIFKLILWCTFTRTLMQKFKHFCYKLAEISFFIIFDRNLVGYGIWCHHLLANLHIFKTWISLERKEIFEKSKWHFSSHTDYLLMF